MDMPYDIIETLLPPETKVFLNKTLRRSNVDRYLLRKYLLEEVFVAQSNDNIQSYIVTLQERPSFGDLGNIDNNIAYYVNIMEYINSEVYDETEYITRIGSTNGEEYDVTYRVEIANESVDLVDLLENDEVTREMGDEYNTTRKSDVSIELGYHNQWGLLLSLKETQDALKENKIIVLETLKEYILDELDRDVLNNAGPIENIYVFLYCNCVALEIEVTNAPQQDNISDDDVMHIYNILRDNLVDMLPTE